MKVNWISVKDKLPEKYIPVWVAMPSRRSNHDWLTEVDYREGNEWRNYNDTWKYMDVSQPLFWAEIKYPDPPKSNEI